jgi:hypothetical protein
LASSKKKQEGVPTDEEVLAGFAERTEAAPPPGMGENGLNEVGEDDEIIEPELVPPDLYEEDYSDLED